MIMACTSQLTECAEQGRLPLSKRILDISVSLALLILLSPIFLIIALLVKLTSRGPIFYPWNVLGQNAVPFVGYKFRTMVVDADDIKSQLWDQNEMSGPFFKMRNDPRITGIGRFLRKFSLDELPQLWSVLRGDMSLVGPRAPSANEFSQFEDWQKRKLSVRPGITCIWQVSGRNEISDWNEWIRLDLDYIDNWTLWLDIKILLKTIPAVLTARGAS
ncbi:MAG: UDP-phosphate galactose phosphotransferase [Deltaproteobacteria bacterium CG11_big_fil_rev_8_21_14_0_20_47_16]|nr:MAG: UDP-phosphate galactose phosphotransferase [Deltaproteobacteria bacterium CG11_big_fil_rev_8_21_14_0_20_47_16]